MNKKLICLALAVLMLCGVSMAYASMGGSDMTTTSGTARRTTSEGVLGVEAEGVVIGIDGTAAVVQDALAEIANSGIAGYFGASLPAGDWILNELAKVTVTGYNANMGPVSQVFTFPTVFTSDMNIVVLVGIVNSNGSITWTQVPVTVTANGSLEVTFPVNVLNAMSGVGNNEVLLSVLTGA